MKQMVTSLFGMFGSAVALLFGGWDIALQTLVLFMGIDWITGGILLPVIFKKSPKSENGRLESRAGWKGLCRKGMTLLFVLIAVRLDLLMGTNYLRDAVCIAFIANEALSILENAGLIGMPIQLFWVEMWDEMAGEVRQSGNLGGIRSRNGNRDFRLFPGI